MNIFKPAAWCSTIPSRKNIIVVSIPKALHVQCPHLLPSCSKQTVFGILQEHFASQPSGILAWQIWAMNSSTRWLNCWTSRKTNVAGRHWLELELQWSYHWSWWLVQSSWCHHLGRSCENDFTWRFSMDGAMCSNLESQNSNRKRE